MPKGDRDAAFDEFWTAYPRRVRKADARRRFDTVLKKATDAPELAHRIIEGARRVAADPNLPEQRFIAHPSTWLNGGGWDDEPFPVPAGSTLVHVEGAQPATERFGW